MIKLENVSTRELLDYYKRSGSKNNLHKYIYAILSTANVTNYQELKQLVFSNREELKDSAVMLELMSKLKRVELLITSYDMCFKNPDIFTFDNYDHSDLDSETINVTDGNNKGEILLYSSPFLKGGTIKNAINNLSIAEIKYLLGHVNDIRLVNNLLSKKRGFGPDINKQVYDAICFYEDQVLRCADETLDRGINLFEIDKLEKREIVESEIKDIAMYLIDTADTLVWGDLTDTHKKRIMTSALSTWGEYTQRDRGILIDTISNYTTLSELKDGVVKKKILDRFIIKKR
ncbi:MAG: hypothetical protein IJE89_04680 [Bacilli bacterium]|nr:hypothetical protein [Bacilli bacterium]